MKIPCIKNNCIKCCKNTNMILSEEDIEKIQKLGYSKKYFIIQKNGWLQLKNKDGLCIFHNGNRCIIYNKRPKGCQLYPITYDNDSQSAIYDKECPYPQEFIINQELKNKLFNLISNVIKEREKRIYQNKK